MTNITTQLETLRQRIDEIDDQLIALLKQRIDVVHQVGEHKRAQGETGCFIRPGREGRMHRRIYDTFRDSAFHPEAALQIWRMLISASTHHESAMTLSVFQTTEMRELAAMARDYFGGFVDLHTESSATAIVSAIYDGKATIGIVPFPDDEQNWWHALAQYRDPKVYVFAKLPLMSCPVSQPQALAIANVRPESSALGDEKADLSYFVLTPEETMSTSRLFTSFQKAGLEARFLNSATQPPLRATLVEVDGFYTDQSPEIQSVNAMLESTAIRWLGAHPKPIAP